MPDADSVRDEPGYAKTIRELRELDEDALIGQHDALVHGGRPVGQEYYVDELHRREADSRERTMVALTWVILGLTIVNVVAVIVAVIIG